MDIKNGQISIIIPVYNSEKFLEKCLESVISQKYKNLQIIVIDDGSTDNSFEICKKYENLDSRIDLYQQENSGVSVTRNFGLQKATGEYVGFVDSDDWADPEMYKKLFDCAKIYDADISICGYQNEYSDGKTIKSSRHIEKQQLTKEEAIGLVLDDDYFRGYVHNKIFRRALFLGGAQIFFAEGIHIQEDLLFVCNVINISSKIAYHPENLYHYIAHGASATLSDFNVKHLTALTAHQKISDICLNINPNLLETLQMREVVINLNIFGKICKSKRQYKEWSYSILKNIKRLKPAWQHNKDLELKYRISLRLISISPFLFHKLYYFHSRVFSA